MPRHSAASGTISSACTQISPLAASVCARTPIPSPGSTRLVPPQRRAGPVPSPAPIHTVHCALPIATGARTQAIGHACCPCRSLRRLNMRYCGSAGGVRDRRDGQGQEVRAARERAYRRWAGRARSLNGWAIGRVTAEICRPDRASTLRQPRKPRLPRSPTQTQSLPTQSPR
jgi:hypothetical protein